MFSLTFLQSSHLINAIAILTSSNRVFSRTTTIINQKFIEYNTWFVFNGFLVLFNTEKILVVLLSRSSKDDWLASGVISITEWIMQFEFIHHPIRTIFLGTIFNGTLWYLYAVLWVWVIFSVWDYDNRKKAAYFLIPLLLTIEVYGRLFGQSIYDINEVIYIFRSFILQGIPFIMSGGILKEHEDKICGIKKASLKFMAIIIVGFLLAFTEYVIYKTYLDFYLSTIVINIGLIYLAVVNREMYLSKIIHHIGKDLSTIIYCIHLPVIYVIGRSPRQKWGYVLPAIGVIVIILISECFYWIRKYIFYTHLRKR